MAIKRIAMTGFVLLTGITQAQVKKATAKPKAEKKWINPVKLTKEERNRPYMDEVLKTRDSITPEEAERRRKNIAMGNPFKDRGYYPKIATLSKGKYLEFHDMDVVVNIGSIKYNRKTKEITEFREIDLSDPDAQPYLDTAGRWFSPDPLSEEFSSWSPYNMVLNNPISNIDPDGRQVFTDFKLLQDGTVTRVDPNDGSEKRNDDRLFATDKKGNLTNTAPVVVDKAKPSDGSIISSLAINYGLRDSNFPKGINFGRTTNAEDAANVFTFAAKNSNVEWGLDSYKVGKGVSYTVFTGHDEGLAPADFFNQSTSKFLFGIHSHKNLNKPSNHSDLNDDYSTAYYGNKMYEKATGSKNYPNYYMLYAPNNGKMQLWKYQSIPSGTPSSPSQKISTNNLGTIIRLNLKNLR
ncbi:JAB-like toxin 1 domain-containing protein [Chryseobacterium fistulae]|uniref:RHS repeat-associated core domain-containing protein n=1 Tax=Chryseobacterium fistulae TaxID=2675058 RepID=A0A6N4XP26_9FLAO|nr:JAB-like toxin 1 domain-containing protein [Chryseobacterium fistulae]CAA7388027.1 hypothetical protein CHRY9393_01876 [Chryseobacterium fistulae]